MTEVIKTPVPPLPDRFPRLRKFGDIVADVTTRMGAVALGGIVLICGVNVVARYFFHDAISWAEEAMIYLMVFVIFSASTAVTWKGAHMHLDMLIRRLPSPIRKVVITIVTLFSIGLLLVLASASYEVVSKLFRFDQRSDGLEAPMWIPQGFVLAGLVLIAFMMLLRLIVVGANVQSAHIESEDLP